ncbi:hypothetical protein D9M68_441280 [compost metagenome]
MCPKKSVLGACLAAALAVPCAANADTFPSKPITIVVPFPPGGPTDSSARLLAKVMGETLHQPVIVDNRAGAGGTIGSAYVARAQPDGYTLLWGGTSSLAVAPALFSSLPYQPLKSFVPIGLAVRSPMLVVSKSSIAAADMTQLIQAAKSKSMTFGSAGNGSIGHLMGEQLNAALGIKLLHVPYKGGAPALTDVLGGQIDLMIDTAQFLSPHVQSGKIRAFAVAGDKRFPLLPNVPTFREATGKAFEAYSWFGLVAPAGTPAPVVNRLETALSAALRDPATLKQLTSSGLEPVNGSSTAFASTISTDLKRWTEAVRSSGVKPD